MFHNGASESETPLQYDLCFSRDSTNQYRMVCVFSRDTGNCTVAKIPTLAFLDAFNAAYIIAKHQACHSRRVIISVSLRRIGH